MGMYTRLVLNVAIEEKAPIIAEIQAMMVGEGTHEGRRAWMFRSCSHYHDNINARAFEHDAIARTWKLSVCFDIKNYDDEIQWFLEFIAPHVKTDDCAGYTRYEERVAPTLIWFKDGKVILHTPAAPEGFEE